VHSAAAAAAAAAAIPSSGFADIGMPVHPVFGHRTCVLALIKRAACECRRKQNKNDLLPTARGVPKRSPIQVLTTPDVA
jgi:hypothetical protein